MKNSFSLDMTAFSDNTVTRVVEDNQQLAQVQFDGLSPF